MICLLYEFFMIADILQRINSLKNTGNLEFIKAKLVAHESFFDLSKVCFFWKLVWHPSSLPLHLQSVRLFRPHLKVENVAIVGAGRIDAVGRVQSGVGGDTRRNVRHGQRTGAGVVHLLVEQAEGVGVDMAEELGRNGIRKAEKRRIGQIGKAENLG